MLNIFQIVLQLWRKSEPTYNNIITSTNTWLRFYIFSISKYDQIMLL